jgi:hypothetical protein
MVLAIFYQQESSKLQLVWVALHEVEGAGIQYLEAWPGFDPSDMGNMVGTDKYRRLKALWRDNLPG